jgi:hypothetical protein
MQYMLLIHVDEGPYATATPEQAAQMSAPYAAYNRALEQAGALVSGERLAPSRAATRVRVRNDKTEVLDGPFADTKEQLGGFYIVEAPDLDSALKWAARCPGAAHGTVEVRAIAGMRV